MPIQRQDNRFTKVPQIYGNWMDCLKYLAKLQPFDNNIRAVAQPTLSYMKRISLVSYTYEFRLWPGMVIWIYAARMENELECLWIGCCSYLQFLFWKCYSVIPSKVGKNRTGDFTRPKPNAFLMYDFPLPHKHIPVETRPRPNSNIFLPEQTGAIATNGCVTAEDKSMKWIG